MKPLPWSQQKRSIRAGAPNRSTGSPASRDPITLSDWGWSTAGAQISARKTPPSTNLHAVDGCPPRSAGTGPGAAPPRSPRRSPDVAPWPCCPVVGRPAPCLSFCLIHPRSAPFTDVHVDRVCAVRGRWRTPVNAGQHCWKACWGQPLRSSNLLSSATSDQAIHQAGHAFGLGLQGCVVSFVVSFILRISV